MFILVSHLLHPALGWPWNPFSTGPKRQSIPQLPGGGSPLFATGALEAAQEADDELGLMREALLPSYRSKTQSPQKLFPKLMQQLWAGNT